MILHIFLHTSQPQISTLIYFEFHLHNLLNILNIDSILPTDNLLKNIYSQLTTKFNLLISEMLLILLVLSSKL